MLFLHFLRVLFSVRFKRRIIWLMPAAAHTINILLVQIPAIEREERRRLHSFRFMFQYRRIFGLSPFLWNMASTTVWAPHPPPHHPLEWRPGTLATRLRHHTPAPASVHTSILAHQHYHIFFQHYQIFFGTSKYFFSINICDNCMAKCCEPLLGTIVIRRIIAGVIGFG